MYPSICLPIYLLIYLSSYLAIYPPSISLSIAEKLLSDTFGAPQICPSICLPIYLSIYLVI